MFATKGIRRHAAFHHHQSPPATDLGFLLAKHPDKAQSFDLAYGRAHVFYPRADLSVVPCRGGEGLLRRLFEPLGYDVEATRVPLDEAFPDWGEGPYFRVRISGQKTVSELLTHLYVLLPVLDNQKHYCVVLDLADTTNLGRLTCSQSE